MALAYGSMDDGMQHHSLQKVSLTRWPRVNLCQSVTKPRNQDAHSRTCLCTVIACRYLNVNNDCNSLAFIGCQLPVARIHNLHPPQQSANCQLSECQLHPRAYTRSSRQTSKRPPPSEAYFFTPFPLFASLPFFLIPLSSSSSFSTTQTHLNTGNRPLSEANSTPPHTMSFFKKLTSQLEDLGIGGDKKEESASSAPPEGEFCSH